MDLIIGGAHQGKLDYARSTFALREEDIFVCTGENTPPADCRCWVHYEQHVLGCIRRGESPRQPQREDAIVIADDIFCGVVPLEAEIRLWREETGRALTALGAKSHSVTRIFCGLPLKLK